MPHEPGVRVGSTHPHQCWILKSHRQAESQICKSHECWVEHPRLSACPGCWELCQHGAPGSPFYRRQPAASHGQTLQEQCQQEGPFDYYVLWPNPLGIFYLWWNTYKVDTGGPSYR